MKLREYIQELVEHASDKELAMIYDNLVGCDKCVIRGKCESPLRSCLNTVKDNLEEEV